MGSRENTSRSPSVDAAAQRLASAIRSRRRDLGLTQAQLADLAGVGVALLYHLERGKPTVRLDKILVVLEVLGLQLSVREAGHASGGQDVG